MVIAVSAILGHFSKTALLFLVPQILNFLFSIPQLFGLLPCPRHRLPSYDSFKDHLTYSRAVVPKSSIRPLGRWLLNGFQKLGVCQVEFIHTKDNPHCISFSNLTFINAVLVLAHRFKIQGIHEQTLTCILLSIQLGWCVFGLFLRHYLAYLVYP
ncbi:hypothetical protein HMI54_013674 [Coelomomyces lativittatus]|nr:hypothetical protein HMI56_005699 [Coelomomyces lativittatus]KAJ1497381.1 hypothetical protein HMI54_013674 [Coelomomyces lativittatus]KAJ1500551.1 hypothetical protein HMI55_003837 [Coelomomyces lativittatus]